MSEQTSGMGSMSAQFFRRVCDEERDSRQVGKKHCEAETIHSRGVAWPTSAGTQHCCLGVLCEIAIENGVVLDTYETVPGFDDERAYLPFRVQEWAGMRDRYGRFVDVREQTSCV